MDSDDLSLSFVSLGLGYPERPLFENNEMPRLYAALNEHHAFESFRHDRDGARLEQEERRSLLILRTELRIEQVAALDIALVRREFADIVDMIQADLDVPAFFGPQIVIRALRGAGSASGADLMRLAAHLNPDQLKLLGAEEVRGVTVQVQTEGEEAGDAKFIQVEVGTHLRDPSKLYIELSQTHDRVIETVAIIEQTVQSAYDYLMDNVAKFAASITANTG